MADHPLDGVSEALTGEPEDAASQYAAAVDGAAIYDARERGVVEVIGRDRAAWLSNLVTNTIKDLPPGEGNHTFATNVKGRIVLDFNMLVLNDRIWLDIARPLVAKALAHFHRYLITEDVTIADRSGEFVRIALLGPRAVEIADALGLTHAAAVAPLRSMFVPLAGRRRLLVRHDFAGVFGLELYVEHSDARACWERLREIGRPVGLTPIGSAAVHVLRVEAGIPAYGQDIDEEILPAETGQIERAVSFTKGCYLGQEVVQRMRSHGAVARQFVGLRLATPHGAAPGAPLTLDESVVGRLTSLCHSYALSAPIGLGYVKSAHAGAGTTLTVAGDRLIEATVATLPFRPARRP